MFKPLQNGGISAQHDGVEAFRIVPENFRASEGWALQTHEDGAWVSQIWEAEFEAVFVRLARILGAEYEQLNLNDESLVA